MTVQEGTAPVHQAHGAPNDLGIAEEAPDGAVAWGAPAGPVLSPMWRRVAPLAAGSVAALTTLGVMWWNPGDDGVPLCPSKAAFGVDCPFCGATRATAALARGHLGRAFDHNALWVVMVPFVVVAFFMWTVTAWTDRPMPRVSVPRWALVTVAVLVVAFGVARNLDVSTLTRWLASDSASI